MKLVRFELVDAPGGIRSGLMYDERVYETDGDKAIGIHELGRVRLHSPVGAVPAVRVFESVRTSDGADVVAYRYLHAYNLHGPLVEIEMPPESVGLDFDVHVCAVMQDGGWRVEPDESPRFVLGFSILLVMTEPTTLRNELSSGLPPTQGMDIGAVFGPFLVTPDDIAEFALASERAAYALPYEIKVNGDTISQGVHETLPGLDHIIPAATNIGRIFPAEILAWPKVQKPDLDDSALGRLLLPTDRVAVTIEGLGTLVVRIG